MNLFINRNDEQRVIQAMMIPHPWEIDQRVAFELWVQSIRGEVDIKWKGAGLKINGMIFAAGRWLVHEIQRDGKRHIGDAPNDDVWQKNWLRIGGG